MTVRFDPMTACCSTAEFSCDCGTPIVGAVATIILTVVNNTGAPADAVIVARLKTPDGGVVLPPVEHDALGDYHLDWTIIKAGQHWWRFEISVAGEPVDVVEGAFLVAASEVLAS